MSCAIDHSHHIKCSFLPFFSFLCFEILHNKIAFTTTTTTTTARLHNEKKKIQNIKTNHKTPKLSLNCSHKQTTNQKTKWQQQTTTTTQWRRFERGYVRFRWLGVQVRIYRHFFLLNLIVCHYYRCYHPLSPTVSPLRTFNPELNRDRKFVVVHCRRVPLFCFSVFFFVSFFFFSPFHMLIRKIRNSIVCLRIELLKTNPLPSFFIVPPIPNQIVDWCVGECNLSVTVCMCNRCCWFSFFFFFYIC